LANGPIPLKSIPTANGTHSPQDTVNPVHNVLLSTLATHPNAPPKDLTRKQFVQEILTLIYSDNAFVDKLYADYTASAN